MSDGLTSEKAGLKTVLAEAAPSQLPVPGSAPVEQLPLLPLRPVHADDAPGAEPDHAPRGAGRPAGSKNKSTKEWRDYLLGRYSSPLIALAETYSRPVEDLAKALGLKATLTYEQALELFKLQLQCAKELAPYVHQKQPMAIEAGETGLINLIIQTGAATKQEVADAGKISVNFTDCEVLDNQPLSGAETGNSVVSNSVASIQPTETAPQNEPRTTD